MDSQESDFLSEGCLDTIGDVMGPDIDLKDQNVINQLLHMQPIQIPPNQIPQCYLPFQPVHNGQNIPGDESSPQSADPHQAFFGYSNAPLPSITITTDMDMGPQDPLAEPNSATSELPSFTPYEGAHHFAVEVDLRYKASYVMSTKLNKLYIDMEKIVPIMIKWNGAPDLRVRALLAFTHPNYRKTPVKRCATHKDEFHNSNRDYYYRDHVLSSINDNAIYDFNAQSQRFSVLVPLGVLQEGSQSVVVQYKFMCKTSCAGGINRTPTDVVFTLENAEGRVLGRDIISVKICSCPKRDKEKEENDVNPHDSGKKRSKNSKRGYNQVGLVNSNSRVKTEFDEEEAVDLAVRIRGKDAREKAKEVKKILENWAHLTELKEFNPGDRSQHTIEVREDVVFVNQPYV